ncbi:hypothetical protein HHK36_014200 [Tetracentron sinense]|uniref:RING-type domain-containing protein n=1 Tax=Tetracentron sinense TaxID=13715 RepID=A0A834ZEH0_TETSI|nr:hypothetical protein HHK36_014200 [Tetracentron sinense]
MDMDRQTDISVSHSSSALLRLQDLDNCDGRNEMGNQNVSRLEEQDNTKKVEVLAWELVDLCFDLDLVLTPAKNSGGLTTSDSLISGMTTVSTIDMCTVCMEGLEAGKEGKQMPCGHVYHATCISTWLSTFNSCPLCRCSFSTDA